MFLNPLHELIHKSPTFFPLIIIGDFNVDMVQPLNAVHQPHNSKYFQIFMNQQILQIQFDISTTKYNTRLDKCSRQLFKS
jgi:hypothetical protein